MSEPREIECPECDGYGTIEVGPGLSPDDQPRYRRCDLCDGGGLTEEDFDDWADRLKTRGTEDRGNAPTA